METIIKTSKVKAIKEMKPFTNSYGTTIYHMLEMENGDKINIGKKSELKIGSEITYEIIETGQQEYNKAKSAKKEEFVPRQKSDDYVKGIEVGHAVNNAVNMLCAGLEFDDIPEGINNDNKIYLYAKHIMKIAEKLKSE